MKLSVLWCEELLFKSNSSNNNRYCYLICIKWTIIIHQKFECSTTVYIYIYIYSDPNKEKY